MNFDNSVNYFEFKINLNFFGSVDLYFSRASIFDDETLFLFFLKKKNHLKKIVFGVTTYFCYFF